MTVLDVFCAIGALILGYALAAALFFATKGEKALMPWAVFTLLFFLTIVFMC